jgi:hypothetical protein
VVAFLLAAALWPPWQTVAQGAAVGIRPPHPEAFVAGTSRATASFAHYLRKEDEAAVAKVDFGRVVLVAALTAAPTPCYKLEIVNLRRKLQTLTVFAVLYPPPPDVGCIDSVGGPYHVISLARRVIGRPLPRRVVLRQRPARPSP